MTKIPDITRTQAWIVTTAPQESCGAPPERPVAGADHTAGERSIVGAMR